MADESPLGTSNWEQWTYVMALQALTGEKGLSLEVDAANKPFLEMDANFADVTDGAAVVPTYFYYFAFSKTYFRVNLNDANLQAWRDQVTKVSTIVTDLTNDYKRGSFDLTSLADLLKELKELQTLLATLTTETKGWVTQTSGEDGPLAGKAIDVMRARLDQYARSMDTWSSQLLNDSGASIINATSNAHAMVKDMVEHLGSLLFGPYDRWPSYADYLASLPWETIYAYHQQWYKYAVASGLVHGTDEYKLDKLYQNGYRGGGSGSGSHEGRERKGTEAVEAYINTVLATVPLGDKTYDVRSTATWTLINRQIGEAIQKAVDPLDANGSTWAMKVFDEYTILSRSFPNLAEPALLNANTAEWSNLNTNLNLNTPNLDFNLNLPNLNLPNFNLNLDTPNIGGDGGPNLLSRLADPNLNLDVPNIGGDGGPNLLSRLADTNGLGDDFFSSGGPGGSAGGPGLPDLGGAGGLDLGTDVPDIGGSAGLPPLGSVGGVPISGLGSNGEILGPGGVPILGPGGEILGPTGRPILGPNGQILGPDGQPILGPNGEVLGPDWQPILGPSGEILGPGGSPILGPGGEILGPGGQPILGPNGEVLGPGGLPVLGPGGEILGPDGLPILGPDGQPILGGPPTLSPNFDPIVVPGLGGGSPLPDFSGGGGLPELPGSGSDGLAAVQVLPDGTLVGGPGSERVVPVGALGATPFAGSGMPMYPPPMGGMGGGRPNNDEERERQTWLTEDEAVWGTTVGAVGSVIGRPEDADEPDEELVVLGPVRGARPTPQSAKPKTKTEDQATDAGR